MRLRLTLSYLGVIREEVKQGVYRRRQRAVLESAYLGEMGWRSRLIYALLHRFVKAAELPREMAQDPHYVEDLKALGEWHEPPGEAERQELPGLLGEEMASVEEELAYEEKANEERLAIEREACLAPQGETWNVLVRQEGSMDRSIDRKVKILFQLRKEAARRATARVGEDGGAERESVAEATGRVPENEELVKAVGNIKIGERRSNVPEKDWASRISQKAESSWKTRTVVSSVRECHRSL